MSYSRQTIDAHQHFWRYDEEKHGWINDEMAVLQRDFMPDHLIEHLVRNEVDGCIAVQAEQTDEETEFLLSLQEQFPFIKGVVGWLDIRANNFHQKLESYSRYSALKGLRHIVQDEPDDQFLLREDFLNGISLLKDYDLTYDILIYDRQLSAAVDFVEHFPDQPFVLDHIGKPQIRAARIKQWKKGITELAQHPNMYCKLSGLVTEADWQDWQTKDLTPYLDVVFEAFGAERLMFGSDWPVCTLAASYDDVVSIVRSYIENLPKEDQEMIMGGNACRFYNLKVSG